MRLRSRIIMLLLVAVAGMAVFVVATPKSAAPVTVSIVSVAGLKDAKRVTVEFLRHDADARFAEAHELQVRVAGRWQPSQSLPKFEDGYLLAGTNTQQLVFDFPRQAEACRFLLDYRVGVRPYCQAYFFLSRYGISQKFPAISKAILKCVPQQPRLRHMECELEIPTGTQNALQPTPGRSFSSAARFTSLAQPVLENMRAAADRAARWLLVPLGLFIPPMRLTSQGTVSAR